MKKLIDNEKPPILSDRDSIIDFEEPFVMKQINYINESHLSESKNLLNVTDVIKN